MSKTRTFFLSFQLAEVEEVLKWVRSLLSSHHLAESERKKIELSIEEAVVNVGEHAYGGQGGEVEVSFEIDPENKLTFVIKDQGPFFNPVVHAEKIKTERLMGKEDGGLGVYLMCEVMDAVHYKREGNSNILTLKKALTP